MWNLKRKSDLFHFTLYWKHKTVIHVKFLFLKCKEYSQNKNLNKLKFFYTKILFVLAFKSFELFSFLHLNWSHWDHEDLKLNFSTSFGEKSNFLISHLCTLFWSSFMPKFTKIAVFLNTLQPLWKYNDIFAKEIFSVLILPLENVVKSKSM